MPGVKYTNINPLRPEIILNDYFTHLISSHVKWSDAFLYFDKNETYSTSSWKKDYKTENLNQTSFYDGLLNLYIELIQEYTIFIQEEAIMLLPLILVTFHALFSQNEA